MKTVKAWAIEYLPERGMPRFVVEYNCSIPELFPTRDSAISAIGSGIRELYRPIRVEIREVKRGRRKK